MQLYTNHIGYERLGPKFAVVEVESEHASLNLVASVVDVKSGQTVCQLQPTYRGKVDQWHKGYFCDIDFSALTTAGEYQLVVGNTISEQFAIQDQLQFNRTFSDVLHYFKSQRCSGVFDRKDHKVSLYGTDASADVHGGWYDASGDVSKYLSHLSYANFMNPQQTPMIVWNMLLVAEELEGQLKPFIKTRLLDEALHGADFLCRVQHQSGFFYLTIFDKWSKDTEQREICAFESQLGHKSAQYQAGFRQGAGVAIAALARAARSDTSGEFSSKEYLAHAETGYWHLKDHNCQYLDDGTENIIDEYCALLAATELFKSTTDNRFLLEARHWAYRLASRQQSDEQYAHFWSATQNGERPFFHAAEAGLPAIALMQYLKVEEETEQREICQKVLLNALHFELNITNDTVNPFGYPRQYVKSLSTPKQASFFIPHDNETGYWWQGENARLGSLAAMAFMAVDYSNDESLKASLFQYGQHAIDWITGLNPYDMCMLDGHGRNVPDYLPDLGFSNAKGGICNGITSGFDNERDIAFNPIPQRDDILQNWRWGEQWIPHAGWYLLAIALHAKRTLND